MNREEQKADIIYKFGLLLSPLEDIASRGDEREQVARTRAVGRFSHDLPHFDKSLRAFTQGEPGADYGEQFRKASNALYGLPHQLSDCLDDPENLALQLAETKSTVMGAISEIPAFEGAAILEAHTPFTTYCRLRDLCGSATRTLTLVDRYMDATVFYRFLRHLDANVTATLVTWPGNKRAAADFAAFLDASRLYASEHGPSDYRLVVHEDIHDRWICCDEDMYQLGASLKDAGRGNSATLSRIDATADNAARIEELLCTGEELYGPDHPDHP